MQGTTFTKNFKFITKEMKEDRFLIFIWRK